MSAMETYYDVIVVGAGIEGSSTAYNLVKKGQRVLLLEQFLMPHSRGSSHGHSRIICHSHKKDLNIQMVKDAFPMWFDLEKEIGQTLYLKTGQVDLRKEGSKGLQKLVNALNKHNAHYRVVSPKEFRAEFPMFRAEDNVGALLDPTGGVLKAGAALLAFQTIFKNNGGKIVDGCPVTSIVPGDTVKVVTPNVVYSAKNVVLTTGPWTGKLASTLGLNLPLTPYKATVFYWKVAADKMDSHHYTNMPCFLDTSVDDDQYHCYGAPIAEYPGLVKVCLHGGEVCDPDRRDQANTVGVEEKAIHEIKRLLPSLETKPHIREYCIITKTPDYNPYLNRHPKYSNIIIGAAFSGFGFEVAPVIGKVLTELVLGLEHTYDLEIFRLDRFSPKPKM